MSSRRRTVRIASAALGVLAVAGVVTVTPSRSTPSETHDELALALDVAAEQPVTSAGRSTRKPAYLDKVVIARMYQNGRWVIPAANDYRKDLYKNETDRRIAYVCEALTYMRPTYVSGLVRLDPKDGGPGESMSKQATVFDGVRKCVHREVGKHVRFDVVLNALHYTDPHPKADEGETPPPPVPNAEVGADRLRTRLRSAHDAFHPDGWFFDFYASPYKEGSGRFPKALEAGIEWIHDRKGEGKPRQFVGGTIWGTKDVQVPKGSDHISVTDRGGEEYTKNIVGYYKRHANVPILMHIDNDPQNPGSQGSRFYNGKRPRHEVIRTHANQQRFGYTYMFPVFFPFGEAGGPAFDMRKYPQLFQTMCEHIRSNCGPPPSSPDQSKAAPPSAPRTTPAAPAPPPATSTPPPASVPLRPVHRGYNPGAGQHLYTGSLDEITQADRLHVELANAFYLDTAPSAGLAPFHRCYLGNGWHLLTGPGCEAFPGAIDEGALGYLATTQLPGTTPLYRMFKPNNPDHFYTTSVTERDFAAAHGYKLETIAGYAWTAPTR